MPWSHLPLAAMLVAVMMPLCGRAAGAVEPSPVSEVVLVGDERAQVTTLRFDPARGVLTLVGTADAGTCPSYLAWSRDGSVVYAVNEWDPQGGGVRAFRFDAATGALTPLGRVGSGGKGPCFACVHPSGRWLLVANYGSGDLGVLPIHADGALGDPVQSVHPGAHAHMALVLADGVHVEVPCLGADHVAQYRFDPEHGTLSDSGLTPMPTAAHAGPRFLAQVQDRVYLVDELAAEIQSFAVSAQGTLEDGSPALPLCAAGSAGGSTGAHVAITPAGDVVLASVRGADLMVAFRRGPVPGTLLPLSTTAIGAHARKPRHFAIAPDGHHLLVAGEDSGTIAVYALTETGMLSYRSQIVVSAHPTFVGFPGR